MEKINVGRAQLQAGAISLDPASAGALATYVGEASTLGIPPGQVPSRIETDLGNGQPFLLIEANGEVWIYRQGNGCCDLHILND